MGGGRLSASGRAIGETFAREPRRLRAGRRGRAVTHRSQRACHTLKTAVTQIIQLLGK
jgi:hypothetical protein